MSQESEGDEFGGDGTAAETQHSNDRDGQPHWQQRMGGVAGNDEVADGRQKEQVHEVHAEGEFAGGGDPLRCLLLLDAGEE